MLCLSCVFTGCSGGGLCPGPVEAVWLPGASSFPLYLGTLQPAGGLLRLQAHGEDHLPALHVLCGSLLYPAQSAGAQPPGLEEDPAGSEVEGECILGRLSRCEEGI